MATMPLGTGAELSTGQRAACQYHNLLQKTTSMGSGGSRTEDRRYDAGAGRFISEDLIKGHTAVPYTMNHYSYCFNRPMDMVDLNGMWPTAVVTSDLVGMDAKSEELDESDPVHIASDLDGNGKSLRDDIKDIVYGLVSGENGEKE